MSRKSGACCRWCAGAAAWSCNGLCCGAVLSGSSGASLCKGQILGSLVSGARPHSEPPNFEPASTSALLCSSACPGRSARSGKRWASLTGLALCERGGKDGIDDMGSSNRPRYLEAVMTPQELRQHSAQRPVIMIFDQAPGSCRLSENGGGSCSTIVKVIICKKKFPNLAKKTTDESFARSVSKRQAS